ncbi:ABC transporter substrate-binding protein [Corynebacterium sphenisci]|uniref:ABC transporter substrate-binding protein n=1 Tax=Corynebacterium sphenisci TaxID=191493 RepID=UPI0026E0C645|nr:ABC transporter substrate-binding protein [Corynebacterium sphenisci]MDO5730559.1 ABC transporter substrate-binding protein [Corynebacterium sphenisci]
MRIGRRITAAGAAIAVACGLGLAGCSSEEGDTAAATGAESTVEVEEGAFPVTIEHAFGATTIEEAPQRIATVGESDVDAVLALGVTPVWAHQWMRGEPYPWQREKISGEGPGWVDMQELDLESIAAAEPDLIIVMFFDGITADQYGRLSDIAPTIAYQEGQGDYQQSAEDTQLMVGEALGRPKAARKLVDDLDAKYAAIRERHPDWAGRTAVIASPDPADLWAFSSEFPTSRVLEKLGFVIPEEIDALGDGGPNIDISAERADLLDQDLVLWTCGDCTAAGVAADPVFANLDVVREGRALSMAEAFDEEAAAARAYATVLSMDFFLDELERAIVDAIGE